eukprot:435986-Pyramimonas_sp.AAC.1
MCALSLSTSNAQPVPWRPAPRAAASTPGGSVRCPARAPEPPFVAASPATTRAHVLTISARV